MARLIRSLALGLGSLALLPAAATAQQLPDTLGPWKGENPFNCANQDVGSGVAFPDPAADPFCVEFDKTSQNVTDLGIVDFLANEPARVAAAVPKCFYFQHDHWTGSIVQGEEPELWNWDGSYFFDRAKGIGGVFLTNLRIGGSPADFTAFVPPEYQPFVEPTGGGGAIVEIEMDPDPICGARVDTEEEQKAVYSGPGLDRECILPGGQIRKRAIGKIGLGTKREEVHLRLGEPDAAEGSTESWCIVGDSELRLLYDKRDQVVLARTTNPGHQSRGVAPGSRKRRAQRRFELERLLKAGKTGVLAERRSRNAALLVGIAGRKVAWLAVADPRRLPNERKLARALGD